jgi:molecular chaperone GrpE (heat shock protein)
MAFWNRDKPNKQKRVAVDQLTQVLQSLHADVGRLHREVSELQVRVNQPVPTNGQPHAGSAVQDWLPVVDRLQELLLVQMGNSDLAQAFGTYARQRELRASEEQPDTTWTEPGESSYENI